MALLGLSYVSAKTAAIANVINTLPPLLKSLVTKFFVNFHAGYAAAKFTITTAVLASGAVSVTLAINYNIVGAPGLKTGAQSFIVPGPNVGAGLSFLVPMVAFGMYKMFQLRRSNSL